MNVTAVTIGINEPYLTYARKGCKQIEKLLNIESRIITEDFLHLGTGTHEQEKIWSLKFNIFDIFPDIETAMYFDVDWRPLQKFNISDYCPDVDKIYFTTDRSEYWFVQELEKKYGLLPGTYVNAGWFVINRQYKDLLDYCKHNLVFFDRSFYGDQCVINQVFKNRITLADRCLNVLDMNAFPYNKILGLHNSTENYKFYNNINE